MKQYYFYLATCRISEKERVTCEIKVAFKITTFAQIEKIIETIKNTLSGKNRDKANVSFVHPPYYLRKENLPEGKDVEITNLIF